MAENKPIGTVLVAGAGISGIKAAIELAETGYKVLLTDSSTQVGGILAKLDYQFPSDHCGMCRMLPMVGREYSSEYCMRKSLYHENIEILPFTEVVSVAGDAGKYKVELKKRARYVNSEVCNELGKCIEACPVETADEFNHGLTKRKAIYKSVPHNVPQLLLIDKSVCTECGECVKVCSTGAINLHAQDEVETREVHAIVLASGVKLYNTKEYEDAKSYAVSPDVVTSLAFERMLSGTGTYRDGIIKRPSDGKPAKKIAWIQCMGSRNKRQNRDYCSSVCCMFALKEAVLAKEKVATMSRRPSFTWICVPLAKGSSSIGPTPRKSMGSDWYAAASRRLSGSRTATCASVISTRKPTNSRLLTTTSSLCPPDRSPSTITANGPSWLTANSARQASLPPRSTARCGLPANRASSCAAL